MRHEALFFAEITGARAKLAAITANIAKKFPDEFAGFDDLPWEKRFSLIKAFGALSESRQFEAISEALRSYGEKP